MQLILSAPVLYSIELTPLCNNRCPGCFNVFVDDKIRRPMHYLPPHLTAGQWRELFLKIKPHAHRLKFTGGEPTLHPEFEGIVQAAQALDMPFTLFTNGRWRDPDRLLCLLKDVPQALGMLISLHGADAETHDNYTGVEGSFEQTVTNIHKATDAGFTVATSTVIARQNYRQIPEIVRLAVEELGADHAVMNRYLGVPLPDIEPSPEELAEAVQTVDRLRKEGKRVKFGNCIPQCFLENSSNGCLAGVAYVAIDPWGNVRPCNHSPTVVGNLFQQGIEEIWHSEKMDTWRNLMPPECESCAAYAVCHGGCRASLEFRSEKRDPLRGEPLANIAHDAKPLHLYAWWRPVAKYEIRREEFGLVLMRGNAIIPVSLETAPLLTLLDGTNSLKELASSHGQNALSLIGELYQHGLIEMS